ncbi:Pectinesterase 2 [Acorus calamus]|uniref:Pectinesterase n=1 Tax=Acorus calamus TaxID=4465 RepID=A0AAV9E731_ACOCL|nr:Pectinesterase 2 [Acorus calamus]
MANQALSFICTVFLLISLSYSEAIPPCSQTPYPDVCNYLISTSPLYTQDQEQLGFRDLAFRATMAHAQKVHQLASAMDLGSIDSRVNGAWTDCMEVFEDTISQLSRSTGSMSPVSFDDTQTWLSATLANQQSCINGFNELNLASHIPSLPFVSNNMSEILSNSLAINKFMGVPTKSLGGRKLLSNGFPKWVSSNDRKLLQSPSASSQANLVVAQDGSGNYKTISEAVAASVKLGAGTKRFVIHVKAGVYNENVQVSVKNLMLIGDGIDSTVVTGSKNVQDGSTTFRSATFAVTGDGFIARGMTFQNTAGPQKHQAVAMRSGSDLSVFYQCSFKGYQDTLYVYSQRQFYRNCDIYGTVDFIFGDAATVLQSCNIYVRKPMSGQQNTVTAQGRTDANENTGISIHNSVITAASDLKPVQGSFRTYLGRPWQQYSRTVVMKSSLDSVINPAGWLAWSGNFALSTLYYGEYMNTGAGASTAGRVKWPGFHIMSGADAAKFTVGSFISGSSWLPGTGVPFTAGL